MMAMVMGWTGVHGSCRRSVVVILTSHFVYPDNGSVGDIELLNEWMDGWMDE